MNFEFNESIIPDLAVGFTRGLDAIGDAIAFCRGGWRAKDDPGFPSHAFLFYKIGDRLVAFEEGPRGLNPQPLREYLSARNRVVAVRYCHCWDDEGRALACKDALMKIWHDGGARQRYGWSTLFHFLPVVGKWIKPAKLGEICSENVAGMHIQYGGIDWPTKILAPDQLNTKMQQDRHTCSTILNYYK